jgi:hypothetical protein
MSRSVESHDSPAFGGLAPPQNCVIVIFVNARAKLVPVPSVSLSFPPRPSALALPAPVVRPAARKGAFGDGTVAPREHPAGHRTYSACSTKARYIFMPGTESDEVLDCGVCAAAVDSGVDKPREPRER